MSPSHRRAFLSSALATLGAASLPLAATAQSWPAKPIKLVVPFPPGGGTDVSARIIGERLGQRLGQPVVIDNKPGASTIIGVNAVTGAEADGYTLLFSGSSSFTVNPAVRPKLPYDPFKQLAPIALVARAPLVLVTSEALPYKSLQQLLDDAAARPGQLTYGTFGPGSGPHLVGEMLARAANVKLTPIPYKGSADAAIAMVRGDITLGIDTIASAAPHLQAGKLRPLAVVADKRSPLLPKVPAYGELQLSQALFDAWYAIAAPAATPAPVRDALLRALTEVMKEPEVRTRLAAQSMDATLLGPKALHELMDEEVTRYRAAAARAGIRLD